jgi:hypothetical protein
MHTSGGSFCSVHNSILYQQSLPRFPTIFQQWHTPNYVRLRRAEHKRNHLKYKPTQRRQSRDRRRCCASSVLLAVVVGTPIIRRRRIKKLNELERASSEPRGLRESRAGSISVLLYFCFFDACLTRSGVEVPPSEWSRFRPCLLSRSIVSTSNICAGSEVGASSSSLVSRSCSGVCRARVSSEGTFAASLGRVRRGFGVRCVATAACADCQLPASALRRSPILARSSGMRKGFETTSFWTRSQY